jgi:hypothetical protein
MKTINQVTNHLISILPEVATIQKDYDILRKGYRELHNVETVESDDEHWVIIFDGGVAGVVWEDIDSYEIEYISDECDEDNLIAFLYAEIRLYDKFKQEIVTMLESHGYEVNIEAEEYDLMYNIFDDNVSQQIIISNTVELTEEPSYIFDYKWAQWQLEKEERNLKFAKFVDSEYNLSNFE